MGKRAVSVLLGAAMIAALLAGCGSSSPSSTSSAADAATTAATEAAPEAVAANSDVSGSIVVWEHSSSFETALEEVIAGFRKQYPNVDVEYDVKAGGQYYNLLTVALQSGDAPDVFWTNGSATANLGELVKGDAVLDLTDIIDYSSIPDNCMDIGRIDGKMYSVPWACVDTRAVYYNKDIFEQNGWEVPKTWGEFVDLLQKEKDAGYIPISLSPNSAWCLLFAYEPILSGFDSAYTEGLADYSVKAADQPARDCLNLMLDWAEKGYFGDNYLGVTDSDAQTLAFTSGEAVMDIDGSWSTGTFQESAPDMKLGAFQIPDKDGKTGMVGTNANGFSIYKNSENLDAAKAFVQYCATVEAQQAWVDAQGAVSGNPNVRSGGEIASEISNCDTTYISWQSVLAHHAKDGENASTLFENDMTKVFSGEMTTDDFFDEIAAVMQ